MVIIIINAPSNNTSAENSNWNEVKLKGAG
jgi:hypothetical protein